jgi:uncharacterized protein
MAIKPNGDERSFGADRERQREVSSENGRSARASNGENVARGDAAPESGSAQRARSNRGFASMDRSKQREIASKGGRAAHQKGTAHEFDSGEARAAGRKGGVTVSKNREHMAAIGRRGGEARGANRAARIQGGDTANASPGNGQRASRFQADREVGFASENHVAGNRGTARQSGNSLGGERSATAVITPDRSIERP